MKSKCLILSVVVALAGFLPQSKASILLSADSFAVLGASGVTSTGETVLNGNLGVSRGSAITGFPAGIVHGTIHYNDAVAQQAQTDALAAYNYLAGRPVTQTLTGDLGGLTLTPGVYFFSSSAQLTGMLTLNGSGITGGGTFVFQIGSTLTTASSSSVVLNGVQAANVYWQVGSSATIAGTSFDAFDGSIIAHDSITLTTGANIISGRALALTGAVTLDDNVITAVPEPGTLITGALLLLPFGASTLRILRRNRAV